MVLCMFRCPKRPRSHLRCKVLYNPSVERAGSPEVLFWTTIPQMSPCSGEPNAAAQKCRMLSPVLVVMFKDLTGCRSTGSWPHSSLGSGCKKALESRPHSPLLSCGAMMVPSPALPSKSLTQNFEVTADWLLPASQREDARGR